MWLRYQQVSRKMASFDPRELGKNKEEHVVKHPLKRFESTLRSSLKIAIPTNLDRLKKHHHNIEKFLSSKQWKDLNMEQINASRTVQQLKATIRELDKMKNQVVDSDIADFQQRVAPMKEEAINAIQDFARFHSVLSKEMHKSLTESSSTSDDLVEISLKTPSASPELQSHDFDLLEDRPISDTIQIQDHQRNQQEIAVCQSWDNLRDGLIELNSLVKDFATVVHSQQEVIDRIEDNIEQTHEHVQAGTGFLAQASKYKAAAIPVAGAVIGGVIGGPIGLMAGFKLAGVATAVGGGIAGYQGGRYLRNKHNSRVEMELDNLSSKDK